VRATAYARQAGAPAGRIEPVMYGGFSIPNIERIVGAKSSSDTF